MAEGKLAIAIDTASELAGVALCEDGLLLASLTWRTRQNHSRELLPAVDWLLGQQGRRKEDVGAVFVCLGPGSYAGLRVGVSTAKALAFGLGAGLCGVGRLAAEAEPFTALAPGRVMAVHAAGRAELAWAAYEAAADGLREAIAPRLGRTEVLAEALTAGDWVVADAAVLASLAPLLVTKGAEPVVAAPDRVLAVARLGGSRLQRHDFDDPDTLVPLYMRAPAIGPQR